MKISKTLEKHKPFSLYTLHLSNGFVAIQLSEMLPNRSLYSTVQQLLRESQGCRKACQMTVNSHGHAGSSGALHTKLCVQHLERAIAVPKLISSFCLEYPSLLQFSIMSKSRVFFHVIWIRSHNEVLGVLKVVFVSVFFPACIVALVGNVTLSNACFKFSEVKPSLIIL